jgi:hypothetical protein
LRRSSQIKDRKEGREEDRKEGRQLKIAIKNAKKFAGKSGFHCVFLAYFSAFYFRVLPCVFLFVFPCDLSLRSSMRFASAFFNAFYLRVLQCVLPLRISLRFTYTYHFSDLGGLSVKKHESDQGI